MAVPGLAAYAKVVRRRLRALVCLTERQIASVELSASELFNNAIQHSRSGEPSGEVVVAVFKLPGRTQVRVIDDGPRADDFTVPHLRRGNGEAESGRGLFLVAEEADRWGTVHHDDGRTSVWFEVDRVRAPRTSAEGEGR
ncbi:ATP-binding protein [Nocardiopsis sp. CNR-923]|uniref:ATP-binding protein n=1 Tax=Nocardiopsis sp. CNR-923 TaxID=1904965 RepID=UPI0021CC758C|nr:ATP-binding protein [Nocardiopsis sp. CNR-923]